MPLSAVKITLAALLVLGAALLQPVTAKPTPQPDYCLALSGKAKGLCIAAHNAADRGAKNAAHKLAQAQEAACGDGIVTPELGEVCQSARSLHGHQLLPNFLSPSPNQSTPVWCTVYVSTGMRR